MLPLPLLTAIAGALLWAASFSPAPELAADDRADGDRAMTPPKRDETAITSVAFEPFGPQGVVASAAGIAEVRWPDLRPVRWLRSDLAAIAAIDFASDGAILVFAGRNGTDEGTVQVLSWPDGRIIRRWVYHAEPPASAHCSPSHPVLALGNVDGTAHVLSLTSGEVQFSIRAHSRGPVTVRWSTDGESLYTAGSDRLIRQWCRSTGREVRRMQGHAQSVTDIVILAVVDGGPAVASISTDRTLRLWGADGTPAGLVRLPAEPLAIAATGDGRRLVVVAADGWVRSLDLQSLKLSQVAKAIDGPAYAVAIHRAEQVLVGGAAGQIAGLVISGVAAESHTAGKTTRGTLHR